jgi:pyridinium-3,5-biscarboxylic acid mononucleotide sulfurtransferase
MHTENRRRWITCPSRSNRFILHDTVYGPAALAHDPEPLKGQIMETGAQQKLDRLRSDIESLGSVVVAFSGGVDSTLLLKVAFDVLGDRCVAASGLSATYAQEEMQEAEALAREIGVEYHLIETMELADPRYADNTHQRCFFCKQELYGKLRAFADSRGLAHVIDGSNADDLDDFRPGLRAARDLGVRSPLQDAGLTKREIREISAGFGLRTADKPAVACLSSRFAYGDPITVEKLQQVAGAESALKALGFRGFRLRHHGEIARLEMARGDMDRAFAMREEISERIRAQGFRYVALDLDGYRAGAMNAGLSRTVLQSARSGSEIKP